MKITDLTHVIRREMQVYPGTLPPVLEEACSIEEDGFKETKLEIYSHTGTHIDCPAHVFKDGLTTQNADMGRFFGRGAVMDCSHIPENGIIELEMVEKFIEGNKGLEFILIYTGWEHKWGDTSYFDGFPVISGEAARYISKSGIKGVGLDTISIEPVGSEVLDVHRIILGSEKVIVENLKNLEKIKDREFFFSCFPLNIENGDGSPVRAVAIEY